MLYFKQRSNGKYGEVIDGDLSAAKKLRGQYTANSVLKIIRENYQFEICEVLTWTDKDFFKKAGLLPFKHGWSDGGQAFTSNF